MVIGISVAAGVVLTAIGTMAIVLIVKRKSTTGTESNREEKGNVSDIWSENCVRLRE